MYYVIRIKEHLDVTWQSWFDDLSIQHETTGTTLLSGNIPDQPALYGIVLRLSQIGVTLLSVEADELHPSRGRRASPPLETQEAQQRKERTLMKVLVAGASGALGTLLTRALIAAGHEVLGLARSPESMDHLTHLGAHPILANVMDRDDLLRAVKGLQADAVIHALTALKKTPLRHEDMYATNALREVGTSNLLAAAREVGAHRFLVESMTMGYGYGDWGEQVITEDSPFAPAGRSSQLERHLAGFRSLEQQIWEATRAGWIEGISLRFGAFYAPGSLVPILELLRRRSLPLPDGGRAVTSWIYLEDAAAATVSALELGKAGEAYNIVDDEPVRNKDFFAFLCQHAHLPTPFTLPNWMMRPLAPYGTDFFATSMRVSNAKAARSLGWRPMVAPTYREGIQKALCVLDQRAKETNLSTASRLP